MAMSVGDKGGEDAPMSEINTTPLVDIMLVLLIIFLITVPVVLETVELELPDVVFEPTTTKPENVLLSIRSADTDGDEEMEEVHTAGMAAAGGGTRGSAGESGDGGADSELDAFRTAMVELWLRGQDAEWFDYTGRVDFDDGLDDWQQLGEAAAVCPKVSALR